MNDLYNLTKVKLMNCLAVLGLLLLFTSSCSTRSSEAVPQVVLSTKTRGELMKDAGEYLTNLKLGGKLPGLLKDDRGILHVMSGPATIGYSRRHVAYPVSFLAQVSTGDTKPPDTYLYRITKVADDSDWRLDCAWKRNKKGDLFEIH